MELDSRVPQSSIHPDLKLYYNLRTYCISKSKLISVVVAHFCESFFIECNSIRVTFICRSVAVIKGTKKYVLKRLTYHAKLLFLSSSLAHSLQFFTPQMRTQTIQLTSMYIHCFDLSSIHSAAHSEIRFQKSTRGKELYYTFHFFLKVYTF